MGQNGRKMLIFGQKCQYLAKNVNIWPKKSIFGKKKSQLLTKIWPFYGQKSYYFGEEAKVLVPTKWKNHVGTLFALLF